MQAAREVPKQLEVSRRSIRPAIAGLTISVGGLAVVYVLGLSIPANAGVTFLSLALPGWVLATLLSAMVLGLIGRGQMALGLYFGMLASVAVTVLFFAAMASIGS